MSSSKPSSCLQIAEHPSFENTEDRIEYIVEDLYDEIKKNAKVKQRSVFDPPAADLIWEDFLFLGGFDEAKNLDVLSQAGITCILNLAPAEVSTGAAFYGAKTNSIDYKEIEMDDHTEFDILSHFEDTYNTIEEARAGSKKILVHCLLGVSRSASVVIAYLMKKNGWKVEQAITYTKSRRPVVRPNRGFLKALIEYEKILKL